MIRTLFTFNYPAESIADSPWQTTDVYKCKKHNFKCETKKITLLFDSKYKQSFYA
jgi:hypothetical protein